MTDVEHLLSIAHIAVDRARRHFRERPSVVSMKADRDMVTEIDRAIENEVRAYLAEATPTIGFLGEEDGRRGAQGEVLWALDPVDGTANFVHGLPLCAVSLGLIQDQRQILGVIDLPFLGERYAAVDGGPTTKHDGRPTVRETMHLSEAIVAIGDYAVGDGADRKNAQRIAITQALAGSVQRIRMLGSAAIDLAWVADGKLDACLMLSNNAWDTTAGVVIARSAGARVTDIEGTPHDVAAATTMAATPGIADELVTLVSEALKYFD